MEFRVTLGDWETCRDLALPIRYAVFVHEQGVPPEMEEDEWDALSLHALVRDEQGKILGTGRLLPDGHIGRMAVSKDARGNGAGSALLQALLEAAQRAGNSQVVLNAQIQALPFYQRHGFLAFGPEFDDAGLPHMQMKLSFVGA